MTTAPERDVPNVAGLHLVPTQGSRVVPRLLVVTQVGTPLKLVAALHGQGFAVLLVPGPLDVAQLSGVDLVLLDSDREVALADVQTLRECSSVPVVVVLRDPEVELLLEAGADDCVPADGSGGDLAVRIRAVLRRRSIPSAPEVLRCGDFVLDLGRHIFAWSGQVIHLPPKEFGLLALLLRRDGRVVAREEALELVWGNRVSGDQTTVDVHVKRLRAKLEPDPGHPQHLLTVRGLGYRFEG